MGLSIGSAAPRLADRLSAARRRHFVGRTAERTLFSAAIAAGELPFQVLYVHGPGGVGKSSLLREFDALCDEAGISAVCVDARHVEPSPEAFVDALRHALGDVPVTESPLSVLATRGGCQVILVDTYETLAPLDTWLREEFLPELPGNTLIVLAGRLPPTRGWRADPGWQDLVHVLPLRNLAHEESLAFLTSGVVPAGQHGAVVEFTHGHPLALSLVADLFAQRPEAAFQPQAAPDLIKTLLEQFVQQVPGPAHRAALEASALIRALTEPLLAQMLGIPDAHDLFEWLRGLSFMDAGPLGLYPHDLAREALAVDLRWRNSEWYIELHRRARTYYITHLRDADPQLQQRLLFDLFYLHRENSVMKPFFEWQESGTTLVDAAQPDDWPHLRQIVERHEGPESAALAEHWFRRQPQGVLVLRDPGERRAGLLVMVSLQTATPDDLSLDPASAAAWTYVQKHAPLRPGEAATLFRFWMARETYQAVSAIQSLIFCNVVRHYLTTSGLAYTLFPCADPDFWTPLFAYGEVPRAPEADFAVGDRRYGIFSHDWRVRPPVEWLALLAERETASGPASVHSGAPSEPLLVLSKSDFGAAVHRALRELTRADTLRLSPLLRTRLIADHAGPGADTAARVEALRSLLREAADALRQSPRTASHYRTLHHTYFQPASSQEAAAELLELPFSTYRRHLAAGEAAIASRLWQMEIGASVAPPRVPSPSTGHRESDEPMVSRN